MVSQNLQKNATKATLISRLGNQILIFNFMHHKTCCSLYRILEAKEKGASVVHVDVDGSYLQKEKSKVR